MTRAWSALQARLRGQRADAGASLAELLVVSLVSTIILGALGTVVAGSLSASRRTAAHTAATAEARLAMDVVARRLRVAVRPTSGAPMINEARANVIDFWASLGASGSTADQLPSRVRYEYNATRKCLQETITPAVGTPRTTCVAFGGVTLSLRYFQVTKPVTPRNPTPLVVPADPLVIPTGGVLATPDLVASVEVGLAAVDRREPAETVRMTTRVLLVNHHNEPVTA